MMELSTTSPTTVLEPKTAKQKYPMYKVLINFFYWLLIKSEESAKSSSSLEVESAANKVVLFNFQGSVR